MTSKTCAFTVLGLRPVFAIDEAALEAAFIDASSRWHPDRFTDPLEQADAAERYAAISAAYHALADPVSRTEALLHWLNDDSNAEGNSPRASEQSLEQAAEQVPALPPDLLMEVMEAREEMEAAAEAGDQDTLDRWRDWAGQRERECLNRIAARFAEHFDDTTMNATPDTLVPAVRRELNTLRYFRRMREAE